MVDRFLRRKPNIEPLAESVEIDRSVGNKIFGRAYELLDTDKIVLKRGSRTFWVCGKNSIVSFDVPNNGEPGLSLKVIMGNDANHVRYSFLSTYGREPDAFMVLNGENARQMTVEEANQFAEEFMAEEVDDDLMQKIREEFAPLLNSLGVK